MKYVREFAVKAGDDLTDCLRGTSRAGNDVTIDGPTTAPVLVGRAINSLLSGGGGMYGGHETLNNRVFVMDNLGKWSKAVGSAGRVRDLFKDKIGTWVVSQLSCRSKTDRIHTTVYLGSYASKLTPQTNIGASEEGAEITTFLAPPFK